MSESRPRRAGAGAQAVIALGVTARLHYLYVTSGRAVTEGGRIGVTVALGLGAAQMVVCLLAVAGAVTAGAVRLKLGACLYAGIAMLVCITYRKDPWDAQLGAAGVYGGLSLWHLASLIELRSINWWIGGHPGGKAQRRGG